ncbi:MAG: hypothetical protein MHPSP_003102, partial [Paramarteilia canceri]
KVQNVDIVNSNLDTEPAFDQYEKNDQNEEPESSKKISENVSDQDDSESDVEIVIGQAKSSQNKNK